MELCVVRDITMADISLHEAACSQRSDLWPIFGSSIVRVFEITERSVSSSLWRRIEQQSIAVLHNTLFCRQYH